MFCAGSGVGLPQDAIVAVALTGSPAHEVMRSSSGSASGSEDSSGRGRQRGNRKKREERDSTPTPESGRGSAHGSGKDDNFAAEGQSNDYTQGNHHTDKEMGGQPCTDIHLSNNG